MNVTRNTSSLLTGLLALGSLSGCPKNDTTDAGADLTTSPSCSVDVTMTPPQKGFQLATDPSDVMSGVEVQTCTFYKVPDVNSDGKPFYVDKIELAQNVGSHHLNVFRQKTIKGLKGPNADGTGVVSNTKDPTHCQNLMDCPCYYSANWSDWPLVVNSQIPSQNANGTERNYVLQLPAKVGYKFTPGEILMVQSHFVNATTQKTPCRAKTLSNFNLMADPTGVMEVGTLFATEQSISICKNNPTPSFTGYCHINTHNMPVTIFAANGHFHSRGTDFKMQTWDGTTVDPSAGTQFYESKTWDEPPMMTGLNVPVPAGMAAPGDAGAVGDGGVPNFFGGVSWTCAYQWSPSPACADGCSCLKDPVNCCYKFGPTVESSEHCNAFVYYYPKLDSTDITCQ